MGTRSDGQDGHDGHEAGLFIVGIEGPASREEFVEFYAAEIRPVLLYEEVSSYPAHNDESYYVVGFASSDPSSSIAKVLEKRSWRQSIAAFLKAIPVGLPHGDLKVCDMPFNEHALPVGERFQVCPSRHVISVGHNVSACPRCGGALQVG